MGSLVVAKETDFDAPELAILKTSPVLIELIIVDLIFAPEISKALSITKVPSYLPGAL